MPLSRSDKTTTSADPKAAAPFLAAIAEPTRIRIIRRLASVEKGVTEVATAVCVPMVNMSHHLSVIMTAEVFVSRKDGRCALH